MKRIASLLLTMSMFISLAGCGGSDTSAKPVGTTGSNTVQNVLEQQMKDAEASKQENITAETQKSETTEPNNQTEASGDVEPDSYNVDLTTLSSTMVFSEVFNMMSEPDTYVGKSVRMNGRFAIYQAMDEDGKPIPDQIYFACIIADATACCSQGLEFVLAGEYSYPVDYPELGDDIVVSGTFETYYENGYLYCHLVDAVFE